MKFYARTIEDLTAYIKACNALGFEYIVQSRDEGNDITIVPKSDTKQDKFFPREETDALRKLGISYNLSFNAHADSMRDAGAFTLTY